MTKLDLVNAYDIAHTVEVEGPGEMPDNLVTMTRAVITMHLQNGDEGFLEDMITDIKQELEDAA